MVQVSFRKRNPGLQSRLPFPLLRVCKEMRRNIEARDLSPRSNRLGQQKRREAKATPGVQPVAAARKLQ